MPPSLASVNKTIVPLEQAQISALDRGFLFGDAVYEVIRVYHGHPWLLAEHFQRLAHSLSELQISGVDLQSLAARVVELLKTGGFGEAIIYIQISRGIAPRKHTFPTNETPTEFFYIKDFHDSLAEERQIGAKAITYPDLRWQRCDIKSTNLLGNVLAIQAAKEADCVEALLYQPDGTFTEGTHTSLFAVKGDVILIPPLGHGLLPGITRELVKQLAFNCNLKVQETSFRREDLPEFTELFLTGTTSEVLPLTQVDDEPIGVGTPGPVAHQLQRAYEKTVQQMQT